MVTPGMPHDRLVAADALPMQADPRETNAHVMCTFDCHSFTVVYRPLCPYGRQLRSASGRFSFGSQPTVPEPLRTDVSQIQTLAEGMSDTHPEVMRQAGKVLRE